MKNFHLPLPEQTYSQLMEEAKRTNVSATTLAREAIDLWLGHRELESAGIEHLTSPAQAHK
jgi:hypothetical protein